MNSKLDLEQFLFDKAKAKGRPIRAVLELSPLCNFNCKFCYIRHSAKEVTEAGGLKDIVFWKELISQMEKMGILIVTLIGGEPLLYEGFREIYSELIDHGFLVNVTTNGSLITDELIELFSKKRPRYVTVSLYGASDETYKIVTGHEKGFSMTISGIEKLIEAGIGVKLNYVVSAYNKDDLADIIKIKEKYHLPLLADAYCFPASRKAKAEEWKRLSPKESAACHMRIKEIQDKDDYDYFCKCISQKTVKKIPGLHTEGLSCYAGSAIFWVSWKGNMIPCGFLEHLGVSLDSMDLEAAWALIKEKVNNIRTSKKCSVCDNREICHVCSASMYWESGTFEEAPAYLCEMTEEIINIAKQS